MKNFTYVAMPVFTSTPAKFQLSIECNLMKKRKNADPNANEKEPNCYISKSGTMMLNPSIYLIFRYDPFGDSKTEFYTSYPQVHQFRKTFREMLKNIEDGIAFKEVENTLVVNPALTDEHVIYSNNKSITFRFDVITNDDPNLPSREPGVSAKISGCDYSALLSVNEFTTIYEIVENLNLAEFQALFATNFIQSYDQSNTSYYQQPVQQQNQYYQPQQQPQNSMPYYQYNSKQYSQAPYGNSNQPQQRQQYQPRQSRPAAPVQNTQPAPAPRYQQPVQQTPLTRPANEPTSPLDFDSMDKRAEEYQVDLDDTASMDSLADSLLRG